MLSKYHLYNYSDFRDVDFNILSNAEISRYREYKFDKDRDRYLIRHCKLHKVLGDYLSSAVIEYDEFGRAFLSSLLVDFSISHSGDYFIIGVNKFGRIGVDIEFIEEVSDIMSQAQVFMNDYEISVLENSDDQNQLFYLYWTAKEAILKMMGLGFLFDPKKLTLDLDGEFLRIVGLVDTEYDKNQIDFSQEIRDNLIISVAKYSK